MRSQKFFGCQAEFQQRPSWPVTTIHNLKPTRTFGVKENERGARVRLAIGALSCSLKSGRRRRRGRHFSSQVTTEQQRQNWPPLDLAATSASREELSALQVVVGGGRSKKAAIAAVESAADEVENVLACRYSSSSIPAPPRKSCCNERIDNVAMIFAQFQGDNSNLTNAHNRKMRNDNDDDANKRAASSCRWKWRRRNSSESSGDKVLELAQTATQIDLIGRIDEIDRTTIKPSSATTVMQTTLPFALAPSSGRRGRRSPNLLILLLLSLLALATLVDDYHRDETNARIQIPLASDNNVWPTTPSWSRASWTEPMISGWRLFAPFSAVQCAHSASTQAAPSSPVRSSLSSSPSSTSSAGTVASAPKPKSKSRLATGSTAAVAPVMAPAGSYLSGKQARLPPRIISSRNGNKRILPVKFIARPADSSASLALAQQQQRQEESSQYQPNLENELGTGGGLQISITPLVGEIRVPVESNALLKCLISTQAGRFTKKFDIHWSRFMYDENVYEQIENFSSLNADDQLANGNNNRVGQQDTFINHNSKAHAGRNQTGQEDQGSSDTSNKSQEQPDFDSPVDRQAQLLEFLSRVRQETNVISEVSIEATLSISPVRPGDNATYYCTATDGLIDQNRARIDLVALSKPIVHLDRVRPARDSKSALIYWLVISDGNTPIKKTILMVRNDTAVPSARASEELTSHHHHHHQSYSINGNQYQHQQQKQFSSVVIDSERHQWQRIDIPADGEQVALMESPSIVGSHQHQANSPYSLDTSAAVLSGRGGEISDGDSVVRADVDVTSSSSSSSSQDDYDSSSRTRWRYHGRLSRRQRSFNLTSLLPGVTYQFRLAAINDMGQSNWTYLTATMPNEIPAQIQEVFLLSRSNDSLVIGWKRPAYDGAKTLRYELQLFDLNRTLTLANTYNSATPANSAAPVTTKFMYIYVNLNPGTDYHFHVRACSRAGCSAYSSPKLFASTLDGEPDEPLDVELNCYPESGNVTVSWSPPLNPRGQLTNYSVFLDSSSNYQNQTGYWSSDEWRSQLDTPDNITLSLETGPILMPNTNYSVKVCANNRSKHCGKQSFSSPRSHCSTPAQLPADLPNTNIHLKLIRQSNQTTSQQQQDVDSSADSLALELPLISRRNGTIDCIQASDNEETSSSNNDHRDDPSKNNYETNKEKVDSAAEEHLQSNSRNRNRGGANELAEAYLAEEIDQSKWQPSKEEQASGYQLVVLGDGASQVCQALVDQQNAKLASSNSHQQQMQAPSSRSIRVFDGSLRPQTYYTGFIKLIHIRQRSNYNSSLLSGKGESTMAGGISRISISSSSSGDGRSNLNPSRNQDGQDDDSEQRILAKYSNYFNPVKTGDFVLEIPLPNSEQSESEVWSRTASSGGNLFRLNTRMSFQEMTSKIGSDLKVSVGRLYNSTTNFVSQNVRLEAMGNFIMRSSPLVQLFTVAIIVLGLSLSALFIIYLITLPASVRRKRKRKLKRQLQLKQQELAIAASCQVEAGRQLMDTSTAFEAQQNLAQQQLANGLEALMSTQQPVDEASDQDDVEEQQQQFMSMQQQQQQQQNVQALASSIGYQQVMDGSPGNQQPQMQQQFDQLQQMQQQPAYALAATNQQQQQQQECPIHSSPLHRNNGQHQVNGYNTILEQQQQLRSVPVHVCQPQQRPQQQAYATGSMQHHSQVQAHQRQSGSAYATSNQDLLIMQQQRQRYDRNCRTMRRVHATTTNETTSTNQTMFGNADPIDSSIQSKNLTLSHHNSILALARKINKSIPLRLFGAIFECRLRNGWLKEEYEQLPRLLGGLSIPQHQHQQANNTAGGADCFGRKPSLLLKLRPQLIVSRNDSASALISGNDQFDASLIRMRVGTGSEQQVEKRIICAKSPLDADSVWDFWRLVYEQEVSTMVMLTQNEDPNTGEIRCAQYWPTCDNEETTILSPCNEYVQKSDILPAKFKIRQETLEEESREDDYRVRLLTLMVMATKPGEDDQQSEPGDLQQQNGANQAANKAATDDENRSDNDDNEKELVIIERTILHLQFYYWNTSSLANQMRLIKFIEMANERHLRQQQQSSCTSLSAVGGDQESPSSVDQASMSQSPMLVHCFNGLGRSGLFTAMSFIIDELTFKLSQADLQQQQLQKLNIFQLVSYLRAQREMLLSPYRLYELLYQLTSNCIPAQEQLSSGQQHQHLQQLQLHQHQHHHHQNQHQHAR